MVERPSGHRRTRTRTPPEPVGAVRRRLCEHTFVRWSNLTVDEEEQRRLPGYRDAASCAASMRPRRSTRASTRCSAKSVLNRVPGSRDAVPLDDQPVQGMQPCLRLLLRPPHPQVPRLRRRPGLRARDRRQGQRAGGAARRAGAAVLEARARRARHQHRPVPVGRGPLQADARDLGGAARRGQPLLGADEVAAAAARPR